MLTLANIDERFASCPNCQNFLAIWQQWRGDQTIPTRSDIRPESLGSTMGAITILEVEAPERLIIRMVSTGIETIIKESKVGQNYVDLASPEDREERIQRHQRLVNTPCGALSLVTVNSEEGYSSELRSLILPVAKDEELKPTYLYTANDLISDLRWKDRSDAVLSELASEYEFIDIGCGL